MTRCSANVRGWMMAVLCLPLAGCFPPPGAGDQTQAERYYSAGKTRVQQQDFKGAVAAFDQALRADPNLAKAHYDLGMVFERELNSPEKALYHYIRALELDPDFQGADLISNRLSTVRMQLSSSATPSFTSPHLAAEIDRLQGEVKALQEERQGLQSENTDLKAQLAALTRQPLTPVASNSLARVPTNRTPESPGTNERPVAPAARTHVIQKGDTLFGLSRRYQISQQALIAANPGLSAGNFPVGRTLVIPVK